MLAASLPALWSSGATVSLSPTDRLPAKLTIESGNGNRIVEVTVYKKAVTPE
jgi:hypothetical protein